MIAFDSLLRRVKTGNAEAVDQLIREFEPHIRRAARIRLLDPAVRRIVDSTDICQSVLAKFFKNLALGRFQLDEAADLERLLTVMVRNKVIDWMRRESLRRAESHPDSVHVATKDQEDPARIAEARDELAWLYAELPPDARRIARQRAEGSSWAEISRTEGKRPDALRVKFFRALAHVADSRKRAQCLE
jgi:RNA polymerase sigma-70 factor (ECF subfamily)